MSGIPFNALDEHSVIVGKTGSGKTYAAKVEVERLLEAERRVCILDPTGAWHGLRSNAAGDGPGFNVAVFGGDHGDLPITEEQAEPLAKIIALVNLPAVIDLSHFTTSARRRFATQFLDALYHHNRSALHLVVDEADEFAPQKPGPDQTTLLNRLDQIVRRGRVKGFRVMMITQRPAVLNKDVLTQASLLVAMKMMSPQDRSALGAWIEGQADRERGKQVIDSLPKLDRGQGWIWWPEGDLLEQVRFPMISTFDSSRTPEAGETITAPTNLAKVDLSAFQAAFAVPQSAKDGKTIVGFTQADLDAARKEGERVGIAIGIARAQQALNALRVDEPLPAAEPPTPAPSRPRSTVLQPVKVAPPVRSEGNSGLGAKGRVLDVLAWWKAAGFDPVERRRACVLAGYSPKASTFGVYLSDLGRSGLVSVPAPGMLSLTEAGAALANAPDFTGTDALVNAARSLLSPAELKVFDAVVGSREWIGRGELADAVGLSRTASTLGVYLSKIGGFGFIETRPGQVRAADWLFPAVAA